MTKKKSRKRYPAVFKTQAVEMAALRGDIPAVAEELEINENNLRCWIADPRYSACVPSGSGESATTLAAQTAQEMKQIRRELALLRAENQVLKQCCHSSGFLPRHLKKDQVTQAAQDHNASFTDLCDRLGLSKSLFYYTHKKSGTEKANEDLTIRIQSIFKAHKRRYGYRRIHKELRSQGVPCSINRVRLLMDKAGLKAW